VHGARLDGYVLISSTPTMLVLLPERDYVPFGYMLSSVCLSSVVCSVRAPYSAGWKFWQCFYGIW